MGSLGDLLPGHNSSTQRAVRCLPQGSSTGTRLGLQSLWQGSREHLRRFGSSPEGQGIGSAQGEKLIDSFSKSLGFLRDFSVPLLRLTQP